MFLNKKLTDSEKEDLIFNVQSLGSFATKVHSYFNMLKQEFENTDKSNLVIYETLRNEVGRLRFYIEETLEPIIKKGNKFLSKNDMQHISYEKDVVAKNEESPELSLLKYYLSMDNIKSPIKHLKIVRIKGFDFFEKLNELSIQSLGEKIQTLSYYYVVDDGERETINQTFKSYKEKSFYSKINKLHNDYLLDKITGFSMNLDERSKPYEFNFDVDDFKDVLNRIKNKTNNVVSFK